jgi:hypothetical protein
MGLKKRWFASLAAGALALGALPGAISAQTVDELRRQYLLEIPSNLGPLSEQVSRSSPGSSSGSPGAFGAGWGDFFMGGGYQHRTRYAGQGTVPDRPDGSVVVGFGLGNPRSLVGVEVAVTSVSTVHTGFFERTAVSLKAHRVLPHNVGVAVGYENALTFGEGLDGGNSVYGVVTKVWDPSGWSPLLGTTTSIGIGNGRFRPEEDVQAGQEGVNIFGSVGVHVYEGIGVIADWTGQDLTLAASLVPFRRLPLTITPAIADVTGSAGDGARFVLGFGMGMNVSQIPGTLFPR